MPCSTRVPAAVRKAAIDGGAGGREERRGPPAVICVSG